MKKSNTKDQPGKNVDLLIKERVRASVSGRKLGKCPAEMSPPAKTIVNKNV